MATRAKQLIAILKIMFYLIKNQATINLFQIKVIFMGLMLLPIAILSQKTFILFFMYVLHCNIITEGKKFSTDNIFGGELLTPISKKKYDIKILIGDHSTLTHKLSIHTARMTNMKRCIGSSKRNQINPFFHNRL